MVIKTMFMPRFLALLMIIMVTPGCSSLGGQDVIRDLNYHERIHNKSTKMAYLTRKTGQTVHFVPSPDDGAAANGGVLGAIVVREVHNANIQAHPDFYTYQYDQRQQAVFMQSLLATLRDEHAFQHIEMQTSQQTLKDNTVLITIEFVQSRVGESMQGYPITLNVHFTIEDNKHRVCNRTHVVSSEPLVDLFQGRSFVQSQTEVSEKLLDQIIKDINQCNLTRN